MLLGQTPKLTLRPYQQACVDAVMADLVYHQTVGAILPTGAGKTEIFIAVTEKFVEKHPGAKVLVLSHLALLTQQTAERYAKRTSLPVTIMQGEHKPCPNGQIILSTMQSARDADKANAHIPEVDLIIIDESHFAKCPSYKKIRAFYPDAKILGVTATPFSYGESMLDYFDKVAFSISLRELIDMKYLVEPKLFTFHRPETDHDTLANIVSNHIDNESNSQAIAFVRTIDEAKQLRNLFVNSGIPAAAITAKLTPKQREEHFQRFHNGETRVLTTVNVLTAGFDAPSIEAIYMPYETTSPTAYLQRIGRGLRLCPEINKTQCRIYAYGDAPTIKQNSISKFHECAITGVKAEEEKPKVEKPQKPEIPPITPEEHQWGILVSKAARKLENLKLHGLKHALEHKQFPNRYLSDLATYLATYRPFISQGPDTPATPKQLTFLQANNIDFAGVTKKEAMVMIAAKLGNTITKATNYIVPDGPYKGCHIASTPFAYRTAVLNKYPNSVTAKIINDYNANKGKK